MAAVSVVEDANGVARLRINNRQQEGSSATFRFDARQAWLPLLLHPAPARALFLGLGTGVTAGVGRRGPDAAGRRRRAVAGGDRGVGHFSARSPRSATDSRLRVIAADARRYVRASERRYDVIVSDNFHPARSGSGALYTVEHFEAVRRRLEAGGLFCQWLPLHQLDLESLRSIVHSFLAAYPHGSAVLATNSLETPVLGLVGRGDESRFDAAAIHDRLARAPLPERLAGIGLEDELAVLGSFVAGPSGLRRLAGNAAANTDDRPVVAYRAPRLTYAPDSLPARPAAGAAAGAVRSTCGRADHAERRPGLDAPPGRLLGGARPLHHVGSRRSALAERVGDACAGARAAARRAAHQSGLSSRLRSAALDGGGARAIGCLRRAHPARPS